MDMLALCLMLAKTYMDVSYLRIASTFRTSASFLGLKKAQDKLIAQIFSVPGLSNMSLV